MIPKDCKRLIEVDFPVAAVGAHSVPEKSIHQGHPATLHLWWARRPLAACRAVLLGLLLPDPCDEHCPEDFKTKARKLLPFKVGPDDMALRKTLLRFIADFASWDMSANPTFLEAGRGLVKAAHPEGTPLVVDPFAGGGSIPLEALRLGCEAFASDLNPVACLILKVMLEDVPRHGLALADELREVGASVKAKVEKELAEYHPKDPDGATPIAYLWARTVSCEAPDCGAEIPLVRSFWLCKKANRRRALRHHVVRPRGKPPRVEFEIFEPKKESDVQPGTVGRAKAKCLCCGQVLHPDRVRAQLSIQHGGADAVFDAAGNRVGGARLLAVVTLSPAKCGRHYRPPCARDYSAVWNATKAAARLLERRRADGLRVVPDETIPTTELRRISVPLYGCTRWRDVHSHRQVLTLYHLSAALANCGDTTAARAATLSISRLVNAHTSFSRWNLGRENIEGVYARQAMGMVWDYCEGNPLSDATGSIDGALDWVIRVIESWPSNGHAASVVQADATRRHLPAESADVWFTDPPYYDSVPYAHLSDLFYVWLRRAPAAADTGMFRGDATPKKEECVVDRPHKANPGAKTASDYAAKLASALAVGRQVASQTAIGTVVFAHKTTEGWEALLSAMIGGGWVSTASWPVATEMPAKVGAAGKALLLSSVHLICRPRPNHAGVGDWGEVHAEMQQRVKEWMVRLREERIRGADAIFSCIGPALESYSRYERVETAAGKIVPLGGDPDADEPHKRGFLSYVFEAVSREALENVLGKAETEGFEEDARLTALFLWTLQTTKTNGLNGKSAAVESDEDAGGDEAEDEEKPARATAGLAMPFDTFIRITRPMGIHYPDWEKRIIEIEKGVVHLRPVAERSEELLGVPAGGDVREFTLPKPQLKLFGKEEVQRQVVAAKRGVAGRIEEQTTLDRLHVAMLLFRAGQTTLLRQLLDDERKRGRRFERLALALTALYPEKSEERRWLEGVQAVMGR